MKLKKLTILLIVIALTSCSNNLKNSELKTEELRETKHSEIIDGEKKVINKETKVFQSGAYTKGFKSDIWLYKIHEEKFEVDWMTYDKGDGLQINKPKDWELVANHLVAFNSKGAINGENSQIVVLHKYNNDSLDNFLEEYHALMVNELEERYEIVDQTKECFVNNGDYFIISKFYFMNNGELYKCYNLLNEKNDLLTEVTYYYKSENWKMHYNIFLDFVNGIKFDGVFLTNHEKDLFDPLGFELCSN